jgi:hypothetical protein
MLNAIDNTNIGLDWPNIVVATAGVVSLLWAVGIGIVIPWWRKPRFSIEFYQTIPYCRTTNAKAIVPHRGQFVYSTDGEYKRTYWVRLKVGNSGRSVAKKCLAKLVEILDENGKARVDFDPTQLQWSGASWEKAPLPTVDLNVKDFEYLAILLTQEDDNNIHIAGDQLQFVEGEKRGIISSLTKGKYILRISIYGENVNPETRFMSLVWNGGGIENVKVNLHGCIQHAKSLLQAFNTPPNTAK